MLNTGAIAIVNESTGTLKAQSGATLEIDSAVTNSGTIKADAGGRLELVGDTITGGTLALNGGATAALASTLEIEGTVTLTAGTTTLSDSIHNVIVGNSTPDEATGALPKLVNHGTISGAGFIGGDGTTGLTLDNFAAIAAGDGVTTFTNELVLNTGTGTGNAIINEAGATLEAQSGATLEIDSNVSNNGGTITADAGGRLELVNDTITAGTLALNGGAAVASTSTLEIEGTVTLSASTTTLTDSIHNVIVSTHDEVSGAATLVNYGNISGAGSIGDGTSGLTLDNYGTSPPVTPTLPTS